MGRSWGLHGVGPHWTPRPLGNECREQISDILIGARKRLGKDAQARIAGILSDAPRSEPGAPSFWEFLANSIGRFDALQEWSHRSRPAAVRAGLRKAYDAAQRLNKALNALDGNSRALIDEAVPGGILSLQGGDYRTEPDGSIVRLTQGHLHAIIEGLAGAAKLAREYHGGGPKKAGRQPQPYRAFLAADVAHALESYLKVKPTSTKDGLFVAVLEAVISDATGTTDPAVHELARRVLASRVRSELGGGMVEYIPPGA